MPPRPPPSPPPTTAHHLRPSSSSSSSSSSHWNILAATFWCLGLLNNASYVIMLACAKNISEGGTALVFLANIVPSLVIKLSAPYWFDRVGYHARIVTSTVLMGCGFAVVASCTVVVGGVVVVDDDVGHDGQGRTYCELLGVALASAQCGLGEASFLALAGRCDARMRHCNNNNNNNNDESSPSSSRGGGGGGSCITCFSSGTGLAGVFGFLWKFVLNEVFSFSLKQTLWLAVSLAVLYGVVYVRNLWQEEGPVLSSSSMINKTTGGYQMANFMEEEEEDVGQQADDMEQHQDQALRLTDAEDWQEDDGSVLLEQESVQVQRVEDMTTGQRLRLVLSLYPYMIPLFVVYAAEYALQAGTWSAIGFPITSVHARDQFYEYSNWMYQIGVFLSRSSGTLYTAPMSILWLMPVLQSINVVLFWWVAAQHVWYNYTLLIPCLYVGLLGGAVYVNGYTRICADLPLEHREFALSSTSVAEGLGVLVADIAGLFIQSCLYRINGIEGAVVSCPIPST